MLASLVLAAAGASATTLSFLTIHSGNNQVHLRPVRYSSSTGKLGLNGDKDLEAVLENTGVLQVYNATDNKCFVTIEPHTGSVILASQGQGEFQIQDENLAFNNEQMFAICPSVNYELYFYAPDVSRVCDDAIGVVLYTAEH